MIAKPHFLNAGSMARITGPLYPCVPCGNLLKSLTGITVLVNPSRYTTISSGLAGYINFTAL